MIDGILGKRGKSRAWNEREREQVGEPRAQEGINLHTKSVEMGDDEKHIGNEKERHFKVNSREKERA